MMALQLKNGDAAYYRSAEYCKNYTSPPVSYGNSSHYLSRLPGPEMMFKPPLSLFRHPQQPFQHMDCLHPLGPPPMAPTQPLCPPPISPAQAIGPPTMVPTRTLGPPPQTAAHTLRPPPIGAPHSLCPHSMAPPQPLRLPPMVHTLGPPHVDHTHAAVPLTIDLTHALGPPHLNPAHALGPPHLNPAHALGPPHLNPAHALGPPHLNPAHALVPPSVVANGPGHFPLPPSPLSSPRAPGPDTSQMPPRLPGPALVHTPVSCLVPGPLMSQAPQAGEQTQDEGSPLATEEQEDSLGLEELCKPLYCKLCNVTLNSAQQAQAHYQGKNHSKKLRNFYAGSQQPPAIRIPEAPEAAGQTTLVSGSNDCDAGRQALYKGATRVILATENDYCKLCDASFSSPAVAQAHYQGKNHAKKLRLAEAQQNSNHIDGSNEAPPRRTRKDGSEYRLVNNRRSLQPASMPGPYYNPRPRQRIPRDLAMCVTPSGQFYCSMCNCGAEQETDFRQHLESKQHKAKVSELRYRHEMENLGYT